MVPTRFSNVSDAEFARSLEYLQSDNNSLTLGPETATELFNRLKRWIKCDENELEELRLENIQLQDEIKKLEDQLYKAENGNDD